MGLTTYVRHMLVRDWRMGSYNGTQFCLGAWIRDLFVLRWLFGKRCIHQSRRGNYALLTCVRGALVVPKCCVEVFFSGKLASRLRDGTIRGAGR